MDAFQRKIEAMKASMASTTTLPRSESPPPNSSPMIHDPQNQPLSPIPPPASSTSYSTTITPRGTVPSLALGSSPSPRRSKPPSHPMSNQQQQQQQQQEPLRTPRSNRALNKSGPSLSRVDSVVSLASSIGLDGPALRGSTTPRTNGHHRSTSTVTERQTTNLSKKSIQKQQPLESSTYRGEDENYSFTAAKKSQVFNTSISSSTSTTNPHSNAIGDDSKQLQDAKETIQKLRSSKRNLCLVIDKLKKENAHLAAQAEQALAKEAKARSERNLDRRHYLQSLRASPAKKAALHKSSVSFADDDRDDRPTSPTSPNSRPPIAPTPATTASIAETAALDAARKSLAAERAALSAERAAVDAARAQVDAKWAEIEAAQAVLNQEQAALSELQRNFAQQKEGLEADLAAAAQVKSAMAAAVSAFQTMSIPQAPNTSPPLVTRPAQAARPEPVPISSPPSTLSAPSPLSQGSTPRVSVTSPNSERRREVRHQVDQLPRLNLEQTNIDSAVAPPHPPQQPSTSPPVSAHDPTSPPPRPPPLPPSTNATVTPTTSEQRSMDEFAHSSSALSPASSTSVTNSQPLSPPPQQHVTSPPQTPASPPTPAFSNSTAPSERDYKPLASHRDGESTPLVEPEERSSGFGSSSSHGSGAESPPKCSSPAVIVTSSSRPPPGPPSQSLPNQALSPSESVASKASRTSAVSASSTTAVSSRGRRSSTGSLVLSMVSSLESAISSRQPKPYIPPSMESNPSAGTEAKEPVVFSPVSTTRLSRKTSFDLLSNDLVSSSKKSPPVSVKSQSVTSVRVSSSLDDDGPGEGIAAFLAGSSE